MQGGQRAGGGLSCSQQPLPPRRATLRACLVVCECLQGHAEWELSMGTVAQMNGLRASGWITMLQSQDWRNPRGRGRDSGMVW